MSSPTGNGGAGHDDLGEQLVLEHLGEAGGQGQQGLAGASLAEQGDEIDVRIHQHIHREILLTIARGDAPDCIFRVGVVDQGFQYGSLAGGFLDDGGEAVAFQPDEFIDQHLRHSGPLIL
jgi:hypothetical protein